VDARIHRNGLFPLQFGKELSPLRHQAAASQSACEAIEVLA